MVHAADIFKANILRTVSAILRTSPQDLILLDIEMPGTTLTQLPKSAT
jgi:CheY-like chemotaxis protein